MSIIETSGFLFHGTTKEYHDRQVGKFGTYRHDERVVWLSDTLGYAWDAADAFAKEYSGTAFILVISNSSALQRIGRARYNTPVIEYILQDEYAYFEPTSYDSVNEELEELLQIHSVEKINVLSC